MSIEPANAAPRPGEPGPPTAGQKAAGQRSAGQAAAGHPALGYLAQPALEPVWKQVAARMRARGHDLAFITVTLGNESAQALRGLLSVKLTAGSRRLEKAALDKAVRTATDDTIDLLGLLEHVTGAAVQDGPAKRQQTLERRRAFELRLHDVLTAVDLGDAPWSGEFVKAVARRGILTKAGPTADPLLEQLDAVVRRLIRDGNLNADQPGAAPLELARLASMTTLNAHALDGTEPLAQLVLLLLSFVTDVQYPTDPSARHALWERVGVLRDSLSSTVLVWGLRPPGEDPWAVMMRQRADLNLVTSLTLHELSGLPRSTRLAGRGELVWACENPQVLQSVARERVPAAVVCFSGNPSHAGRMLLGRLLSDGAKVRYHGDFDWPGIQIAARLHAVGVEIWRMGASDYVLARAMTDGWEPESLRSGTRSETPWDPQLASVMATTQVAVHEESMVPVLIEDIRSTALGADGRETELHIRR